MLSLIEPAALWLFALALPLFGLIWINRADLRRRLGQRRLWALLVVRALLLAALVLALAGLQIGRPVAATAVVFLIDASDSVGPAQRAEALRYIEQAAASARPDDLMAVVVFGARAAVERVAEPPRPLNRLDSVVVSSRTNIEDAISLALALLPGSMHHRLVLFSDGGENEGEALRAARLAAARGVPIEVVSLAADGLPDALITALTAPVAASADQQLPLRVSIESKVVGPATVQLLADGQLVDEAPIELAIGSNQFTFTLPAGAPGFRQFEARLIAPFDSQSANNRAVAFTFVSGPARVLLIAANPAAAAALAAAWRATGLDVTVQTPAQVSASLIALRAFDTIALFDTPAEAVSLPLQRALATYVSDLGGGLLVIGGPQSFGAGGWRRSLLEPILPITLDPPLREERPDLALALVIDRSGSMSALVDGRRNQLDLAREAVYQASRGLSQQDQIAIIAFDSTASILLPLQPLPDLFTIETALSRLAPGGGTNIRAGMALAAETIAAVDARIRHVILLTDGVSETEYADLIADLRAQGVTVSAVAIGFDTDPALERAAQIGGGAYYLVQRADAVPQIFLQETIRVANRDLIEEPFIPRLALPSPLFRDVGPLPPLRGRNAASSRPIARNLLVADDGSPVLAVAQIGLGRTLAWSSDLSGRWASEWLTWPEFPRFAAGLVAETLTDRVGERITLETTVNANRADIDLIAVDERGIPLEIGAIRGRLRGVDVGFDLDFVQVAPGRYRATVTIDQIGAYLAQVSVTDRNDQPLGSARAGLAVSYSPEYSPRAANPALLAELARLTNGQIDPSPAAIFTPTNREVREVWLVTFPLLWLALILLPIDIALRRLFLPATAFQPRRLRQSVSASAPAAPPASPSSPEPPPSARPKPLSDEERIAALLAAKRRRRQDR